MPFVGGLGDFLYQKGRDKVNDKNTTIQQILQAAGLAKDIWSKFQDRKWGQEDLAPGSAMELADQRRLDRELQGNKSWLDYQNANPGKPAEQLTAEFYQTPEGQAFLDDQAQRAEEAGESETARRIRE